VYQLFGGNDAVPISMWRALQLSILLLKPQVSVTQGCQWWAWLAGHGRNTLRCEPARSRRWAVEVRVFTHAHDNIPCSLHVYGSRPIGASLLTTSLHQGLLALKACTQVLAGRGDGYPLNTYHRSSNSW